MITGNIGEWSEIYTLFKVLSDIELYAGDSNLNRIRGLVYPIIKILRDASNGTYEFSYNDELVIVKGETDIHRIPLVDFKINARRLLEKLHAPSGAAFSIPEIETFMASFNCISLKAKSSVKSDIRIIIHDPRTGANPELGFSIKSQLGGASTLLNAGKTTNFTYLIQDISLTSQQIREINSIESRSKIMDRIHEVTQYGGNIRFFGMKERVFLNNLILIDSKLPAILAHIVYLYYTTRYTQLSDLVEVTSDSNPLNYNLTHGHPFYLYKIKRFISDIALGMMPSKVWEGNLDVTGGYLVVKEDGEVLCYHIYNRNEFENYLLANTKLETASSTRHDFGYIYSYDNKYFIDLNLQIRFIK